ncbi:hypothetical protein HY495_00860 [Candidatus Woesearchaeota archaeon]|nr:hypothetical protein [Candidatus Woesearchaeota archaeon]
MVTTRGKKQVSGKKKLVQKARASGKKNYDLSQLGSRDLLSEPVRPIQIHALPGRMKMNSLALGYALGAVRAVVLLVISVLGLLGYAEGAVSFAESLHITFSLSLFGILAGLVETMLWGFLMGLLLGWVYNLFSR